MARPKLADGDKRSQMARARMSLAEKAQLIESARKAGMTEAEYIRARCLGHQIHPPKAQLDNAAIARLNRIGVHIAGACNNANQLARSVHRGSDFQAYWKDIGAELKRSRAELRAVMSKLLDGLDE